MLCCDWLNLKTTANQKRDRQKFVNMARKFWLKRLKMSHLDIELPNLVHVFIGRSPKTKIQDLRLSKSHLKLVANSEKNLVKCTILGQNPSKINGKIAKQGEIVMLKSGDKIELLEGLYEHEIVMIETKEKTVQSSNLHKNHWSQALYNSMEDPEMLIFKSDTICIIKDKYPKAQKHFLVLPLEKISTLFELEDLELVKQMIRDYS